MKVYGEVNLHLIFFGDDTLNAGISFATSRRRQEERLVLFIKGVQENPDNYLEFLKNYWDRGRFANDALHSLRHMASGPGFFTNHEKKDNLKDYLALIFSRSFPTNRGLLLFYLALHLNGNRDVVEFIKSKIVNNYSIGPYISKIMKLIGE